MANIAIINYNKLVIKTDEQRKENLARLMVICRKRVDYNLEEERQKEEAELTWLRKQHEEH